MVAIVIGVVILIFAGLVSNRVETKTKIDQTPTPTALATPSTTSTPSPSVSSTTSANPTPTPKPTPASLNSQEFQYPNSVLVRSEGSSSTYESTDDPDVVTNWYKDKIKSLKLNAKSFVTTKTNGIILNKLVGADARREIRVEISKKSNEAKVNIIVNVIMTS